VLDTAAEERFDRITRLTCRLLGTPIALVSLVDDDRQWFKSRQGLAATETPRDISFCGHAIAHPTTMIVSDALEDERFFDNPLVTGAPSIRFYAGRPISSPGGHRVGTLCAIDRKPRQLSPEELQSLDDLACLVEDELSTLDMGRLLRLMQEQENRFRTLASFSPIGIFQTDGTGGCVYTNERWRQIAGLSESEALGDGWTHAIHPEDREAAFAAWHEAIPKGQFASVFRFQRPDGAVSWVSARAAAIRDTSGAIIGWVGTDEDITAERHAQEALRESEQKFRALAGTDALTGLANTRSFSERLRHEVALAERHGIAVSVAMIDIDHFKQVNDVRGHDVGDAALVHVADLLRRRARETDLIARLGGDELAVLFTSATIEQAMAVTEEMRVRLAASPLILPNGQAAPLTMSAGVATLGEEIKDERDLLKAADSALYRAKGNGRNRVCL
jgi:diguanylate cyclase (GGDEF)-like protein/PAS domain S-box-containing protein